MPVNQPIINFRQNYVPPRTLPSQIRFVKKGRVDSILNPNGSLNLIQLPWEFKQNNADFNGFKRLERHPVDSFKRIENIKLAGFPKDNKQQLNFSIHKPDVIQPESFVKKEDQTQFTSPVKDNNSQHNYNSLAESLEKIINSSITPKSLNFNCGFDKETLKNFICNGEVKINELLLREINKTIVYDQKLQRRIRVNSGFDLLGELTTESESEASELSKYIKISTINLRRFSYVERQKAIKKYLSKKEKRKDFSFIRYTVRKELAKKRLRFKGKFVRKPKVDLKVMADDFEKKREKI